MRIQPLIKASVLFAGLVAASPSVHAASVQDFGAASAEYESVNCEGAPVEAILQVMQPAGAHALIFCTAQGHTVAPVDGYVWLPAQQPTLGPFFFVAAKGDVVNAHDAYFTVQSSAYIVKEALEPINKVLDVGYGITEKFNIVKQLGIASNQGMAYSIFFFVADGKVKYVLGCTDACQSSMLLRQYTLEEAAKLVPNGTQ